MSNQDKTTSESRETEAEKASETGSDQPASPAAARAVSAPGGQGDDAAPDRPGLPRRVGAVAWLALLLALAAAGMAGGQWWLTHDDSATQQLAARLDEQAAAIESRAQQLAALAGRLDAAQTRLDELANQAGPGGFDPSELRARIQAGDDTVAQLDRDVQALSRRLDKAISELQAQLEQGGAVDHPGGLEAAAARARFRLGLIEIAALLRLGQARAELALDRDGAIAAYRQAQLRLAELDDSRLQRLGQLLAGELEELRAARPIDLGALAGQLVVFETEAANWPLAVVDQSAGAESDRSGDSPRRGWAGAKAALAALVRVSPRSEAPLSAAALESVRERVRLHLAAAQMAAARRSGDELADQLGAASELIRAHFNTRDAAVARALETLQQARTHSPSPVPALGDALAEAQQRLAAS